MQESYFIISAIVCFIVAIYRIYKKSKYVEVHGECIYVRYHRGFAKKCGYKYEYNGYAYEYYDKAYYPFFKAKKGDMCKLYIKPDNSPNDVFTPQGIAITRDLIILGICYFVALAVF